MIIDQLNEDQFINQFQTTRPNNFSLVGLRALYEWLEDLAVETDTFYELDVIALCCEFTEYENLEEVQGNYWDIKSLEDLHDRTCVLELSHGGLIIQVF